MKNIVFYISGHGYGHATRSIELIKTLMDRDPSLWFHIRTDAPHWLFELNLTERYSLHSLPIDVGAVQETSFSIDKNATLQRWHRLLQQRHSLIADELAFQRTIQPCLIIGDIPPLAFEIAHTAQIPSVAVGNFSWDWIYQDYLSEYPDFADAIEYIRLCYRKAGRLLRLPFHGDLSAFASIRDIPLIARKGTRPKEEVWQHLKLDREEQAILVLVALRAADLALVDLPTAFSNSCYRFITFGLENGNSSHLNVAPNFMRFADLVNSCDLVISKLGYGIVSEIIANRVPLLYTSRNDFVEYPVLEQGLKAHAVCRFMPPEDFVAGKWDVHLQEISSCNDPWPPTPIDGAQRAADEILKLIH
ncbi:hypothetical protein MJD09_02595 [bacterium]|nr:hypothetical protein [bacterium]